MSFTVATGILAHPHNPCPLFSHHPLRWKATAQIWQLVKVSK